MKKITCFTESLCGGGAEHQLVILAGFLAERGYDVTIVTYASLPDHYDTPAGVKRIDIGYTRVNNNKLKAIFKLLKVFHYFFWLKTDCVISYRQCANLRVLPPMFFRNSKNVKVICSDRNTELYLSFKHKLLLNILYKRAHFVVPNSKTETDFITLHKPSLLLKLKTIHNYTDLQHFEPFEMPTDKSIIKVAVFSRFSSQKNPIRFAESIKVLKAKTNQQFEVHWYGDCRGNINGTNAEYIELKRKIEEFGIEDTFFIHSSVKDPTSVMGIYHAICLPSLYEGFSNSVAEGICCGRPMLVSDVSDNSIMVHDGINGFLFNPLDNNSICDAFVKFFMLSLDEMYCMSKESRRIAESLFDKESFVNKYIALIES